MKDAIIEIFINDCQVRLKELETIADMLFPRSKKTPARIKAIQKSIVKLKKECADAEERIKPTYIISYQTFDGLCNYEVIAPNKKEAEEVFWNAHDLQDGKIIKIELVGILK